MSFEACCDSPGPNVLDFHYDCPPSELHRGNSRAATAAEAIENNVPLVRCGLAERVETIRARTLRLEPAEMDSILPRLGIQPEHLYVGEPVAPGVPLKATPEPLWSSQLCYVKEFGFRDNELRMRNLGGARSQGTQQIRQWFEQVRQGLNPFKTIQNRKDSRVHGAMVYPANASREL